MAWLIAGLFVLLLIGGLIGFARVREQDRQPTDDTLVAELLGEDVPHLPDDTEVLPAARPPRDAEILPAARPPEDTEAFPVARSPRPAEAPAKREPPAGPGSPGGRAPAETGAPPPATGAAAEDGDWLESQLAWIRNWSQRVRDQLGSDAGQEPDRQD